MGVLALWRNLRLLTTTDFEGASISRRMRTWGTSSSGPSTSIYSSMDNLKYRSRDLHRNNPNAFRGVDIFVSEMIGRGITPRWNTGDPGLDKDILDLWNISVKQLDYNNLTDDFGVLDFYGLQELAARTLILSGGVLVQFKPQRINSGLEVPIQIQLMEDDHLYGSFDEQLSNGNSLKMGIEFNKRNKRVAYHVYKTHPGDTSLYIEDDGLPIRIPVNNMLYVYRPYRPGQLRGWPGMAPIITRLYSLDEYEDAELARKKTAAMYAAFITSAPPDPSVTGFDEPSVEYEDEDYLGLEPAMIQTLAPGEDVRFSEPADVGGNYEAWIKQQKHDIAAGMGITYEQLTGDLTGVSYSSIRAGTLMFQRRCRMLQANILVHMFCRPTTTRWLDTAVLSRAIRIPRYLKNRSRIINNIWDPDGWDWVDPLKDVQGEQLSVRCGFKSRAQTVAERGGNISEVDRQIAEDNQRADEHELILDSDPRNTSKNGSERRTLSNVENPTET